MNESFYSIVIPVYNSEQCLSELVERIDYTFSSYGWKYEIIFINDHSTDNSLEIIKQISNCNSNIKYISFRKNYGQHSALLAGFRCVAGNYIITMDDDLQNPPEEIPKLIKAIQETNYDIIFAKFEEKRHSLYRRLGSKVIKWLNERIFDKPKNIVLSNFRIIKREIVDEVIISNTPNVYLPGLLLMTTNNCGNIVTKHDKRKHGKSNYTFKKLFKLVRALVFVFSDFSLKIIIKIGLFFSIIGFILSGVVILKDLIMGSKIQGWTSTIFVISVFSSINLLVSGVLGEYLLIILKSVNSEKQYVIKETNIRNK